MSALTIERVRSFVVDDDPSENPTGDYEWSDDTIIKSFHSVAKEYNGLEPVVDMVSADCLPDSDEFLNGVAAELMRRSLILLKRRDISYQAGDVTASVTASKIKHYGDMFKEYHDEFIRLSREKKMRVNLNNAFGHFY